MVILFFGELLWDHFVPTFLMSRSSVKTSLIVSLVDVHLLCYASDSQPTNFTHNLTNFFAMFSSVLLVADRPDLSSSVTLALP
jgi:hypothetical protein